MRRAIIFIIVLIVLGGLSGGLYYFQFILKPVIIQKAIAGFPRPVTTIAATAVKADQWVPRLPAIGTFRASQAIDVSSQVGGIITKVDIDSGQDVKKGDLLVELDASVEQADLQANQATLKNADLALQRQKQLVATSASTQSSLDAAQAARDSAAAQVVRSQALIAQKTLTAPFAGRLGVRKVDVGQYLSPGMSVVTLQQLDPIFVDFQMPEQNLAVLNTGETIEVTVDAFPGKIFTGMIASIDARVAADTRNVLVRGQLANADKRLLQGMFANVNVLAGAAQPVITVPATAVTYSLYGDLVYVVTPAPPPAGGAEAAPAPGDQPLTIVQRAVQVGESRGGITAISSGLKAGEIVATEGQLKIQPNSPVRIDNSANLPPVTELPKP